MKQRNKLFVFLLAAALCAAFLPMTALAAEAEEPSYTRIEIATPEDWLAFAEHCTLDAWSRDKEVVLKADISLLGLDCQPIPSFGGRFLGGGYTISGLSLRSSAAPTGLFGETQPGAEIWNLHVLGTVAPAGDGSTVGGLVGRNRGLVIHCSFEGSVTGKSRTGGLVGLNTESGVVEDSEVRGSVSGKSMTGGVAGRNDGVILDCRNDAGVNIESADPNLNLDDLSLSTLFTAAEDSSMTVMNIATDTGGLCGYSAGTVSASINYGTVGYPHIGYNVGGVVGRNMGFLDTCRNYGSVYGRRDIGGIAGQMEPYVELVLTEDMAQKLQQQMSGLSYLLNETAEDARSSSDDAADRLSQIARSFQPVAEAALSTDDPAQIAQQLGSLTGSIAGVSGQLDSVAAGMRQSGETLSADMQQVIRQLNAVNATLSQAIDAAGTMGTTDILSDTSQENVDAVTTGKALGCRNTGSVAGDINVGGVAGSMSVEVEMDPEGDRSGGFSSSLVSREYQMKSILQSCVNLGSVTARKNCAGSVCGRMELGLIYGCQGFGAVESESGDYVGGIVGLTQGVVRSCWAKCFLRGGSFVGGIAGSGTRSESTGAASMIAECRSMVDIPRSSQYAGAIAGGEDGDFSDNLFVEGDYAGVNRLNRAGQAEPVSYEEMLQQENLPSAFRNLTLEFILDGERLSSRVFRYGDSFSDEIYPSLPEREGCYAAWDVAELSDLRFDTVVTARYFPAVTALRSVYVRSMGKPVFFAEGAFRAEDALNARRETAEDLESITGGEPNIPLSALRGDFSRSRSVREQWTLTIPSDGAGTHVLRYLAPEELGERADIYVKIGGRWQKAQCGRFGSYRTFSVPGSTVELAVVETAVCWQTIALCALLPVLLLLGLLSLRRNRKKRRTK